MRSKQTKPVKSGGGALYDQRWQPIRRTRRGAQRIANRMAARREPRGFWHGVVADCGTHYRVNIAGQSVKEEARG